MTSHGITHCLIPGRMIQLENASMIQIIQALKSPSRTLYFSISNGLVWLKSVDCSLAFPPNCWVTLSSFRYTWSEFGDYKISNGALSTPWSRHPQLDWCLTCQLNRSCWEEWARRVMESLYKEAKPRLNYIKVKVIRHNLALIQSNLIYFIHWQLYMDLVPKWNDIPNIAIQKRSIMPKLSLTLLKERQQGSR